MKRLIQRPVFSFITVFAVVALLGMPVLAQGLPVAPAAVIKADSRPPTLKEIQQLERQDEVIGDTGVPLDIRREAVVEAAVSFGARAGLASRTFEIREEIGRRSRSMDQVFDFRKLLVAAPSGLLIEPPVVSESLNALIIDTDGQQAAVSDRILNIINNARIVSAPRDWRVYLEREFGEVTPPPDILLPENSEEREIWIEHVTRGWEEGAKQADEIFEEDINLLTADYQGMVRYRVLLAQGMISAPFALQTDRGVTGGGGEMRIGDRAVQITGVPQFIPGSSEWQPASR